MDKSKANDILDGVNKCAIALSPDGAGFKLTVWEQGVKSDHTCAEKDREIVFAFNASLDGTQKAGSGGGAACGYCQQMLCPSKEGSLFGQVVEGLVAWVAGGVRVCRNSNDTCAVGQFRTDD